MSETRTIFQINIEGGKHNDLVHRQLDLIQPDLVTAQEVMEEHIPLFERWLGMPAIFLPMLTRLNVSAAGIPAGVMGIAQFSRETPNKVLAIPYARVSNTVEDRIPVYDDTDPNVIHHGVLGGSYSYGTVLTTHFCWTPRGEATEFQQQAARQVLERIEPLPSFIFTGDFNAPRGRATYHIFAQKLRDHVPPEMTTTLDNTIHRSGENTPAYVVDYVWSKGVNVESVTPIFNVSDHCALVARVATRE